MTTANETADVVGVLAEALAQHQLARLLYDEGRCACGYWFDVADDPHSDRIRRMHREHVASVVAALPNIAIVPRMRPCDGSETCNTNIHIHGCYADLGTCDDPHDHVTASYHDGVVRAAGGQL